ncbi:unnamed protein product [Closterium sp. Naga37s-1]|nr:unnamed protein product [Closterium sp. Naga37s-1]
MPRRNRFAGPTARAFRERRPGRTPLAFGFLQLQLLCVCACALCPSPSPVTTALAQVDNVQIPPSPVAPSTVQPAARRAGVSFSLLKKVSAGARCLDGSPPGYYYRRGHGTGQRNWLIFLPGGAWCYSVRSCRRRANTLLGSSSLWPHPSAPDFNTQLKRLTGYGMDGMLHGSAAVNPRFFNWHVVLIAYCDGAAFSGTRGRFNASRSASLVAGGRSILKSVIRRECAPRPVLPRPASAHGLGGLRSSAAHAA